MLDPDNHVKSVAVIGNYMPRLCGIATFTTDLVRSMNTRSPETSCRVIAINDQPSGYDYPQEVKFKINNQQISDYQAAADFLWLEGAEVICVQHEFGIFGGTAGEHILELLKNVRIPIVTTLHTVLAEPSEPYRRVTKKLAQLSDRLVVLSQKSIDILQDVYGIHPDKITLIPHGIPNHPLGDPDEAKVRFSTQGRKVLLTFGLLSRNKSIETVLDALPAVVEKFPEVLYNVLGATHPNLLAHEGDAYRDQLREIVRREGLEDHVRFFDTFVDQQELCNYLAASDVFITPYANRDQVVSGTLSYALGMGVPVVSTPYWYAEEALADGRGCLVPFKRPEAMSEALIDLLGDEERRQSIRQRAYDHSRQWVWESVAGQYLTVFREVRQKHVLGRRQKPLPEISPAPASPRVQAPDLNLNHLDRMSNDTGLWQHAHHSAPNREYGYCTDDNARALIVVAEAIRNQEQLAVSERLYDSYFVFLQLAFDTQSGRFRNFMSDDHRWLDLVGSQDSHGRALWGLGEVVAQLHGDPRSTMAADLFRKALPAVETFFYPRSISFTLIGIQAYLTVFNNDSKARKIFKLLADRLYQRYRHFATDDWPWFEDKLTYDNAKLPHALLLSGSWLGSDGMIDAGLRALEWLMEIQTEDGYQAPIGNRGWYRRGGEKARFDQQPIDAHATVHACHAAYTLTGEGIWLHRMMTGFDWFLGHNHLNRPVFDAITGGCRDGLEPDHINLNQGAESTLAWLMSRALVQRVAAEEAAVNEPFAVKATEHTARG